MSRKPRAHRAVRFVMLMCAIACASAAPSRARLPIAQVTPAAPAAKIVLPPKIVAGQPTTLAVLDAEGKLASAVTVDLGSGLTVRTDRTGRAFFNAPTADGVLVANASGASAAALVDAASPARPGEATSAAAVISLREPFAICGGGFDGNADENRVSVNDNAALIVAASPECLVALPPAGTAAGPVTITVETGEKKLTTTASAVSIDFPAPNPALVPGEKGRLSLHVLGSRQPLRIVVENGSPDVIRFMRGDAQEVRTSGGAENAAEIAVQAIRSGDFSFHTRVLRERDAAAARRYLQAAEQLEPKNQQREMRKLAGKLAHPGRNTQPVRRKLASIAAASAPGDFRTLVEAARAAL